MDVRTAAMAALLVGAALAVGGVVLVKLAFWPRRRGTTPHCRRCDYILQGIKGTSDRCPECGSFVTLRHEVIYGERRRRPGLGMLGVFLVLFGGAALVAAQIGMSGSFDAYYYWPATWLVRDASSLDPVRSARAWDELSRRMSINGLAAEHHALLTEAALAEHARAVPGPIASALDAYLADRVEDGKLTEAQKDRFFRQAIRPEVLVRRVVTAGVVPTLRVRYAERALGRFWFRYREIERSYDGKALPVRATWREPSDNWRGGWWEDWLEAPQPGKHRLEMNQEIEVYRGPESNAGRSRFLHRFSTRFATEFTAVAAGPAPATLPTGTTRPASDYPDVQIIDDPSLHDAIKARFKVESFTMTELPPEPEDADAVEKPAKRTRITGIFSQSNLPVDVACDVIVRFDGPGGYEHFAMSLGIKAHGSDWRHTIFLDDLGLNGRKTVDLIFRAGPDAARRSIDLYRTWRGEIIIKDVPVALPQGQ